MDLVGPAEVPVPDRCEPVLGVIAEQAALTDVHGVSRTNIDALATERMFGAPWQPNSAQRELAERIAMADASTWFCWAQHQTPLAALANAQVSPSTPNVSGLQELWLERMRSGSAMAGVAFAHLRRGGLPNPQAERVSGGWRVNGSLDWVTSWDIADVVVIMVRSDDLVVSFLMPAGYSDDELVDGVHVGEPLSLLAMGGTHTRPMLFSNAFISDDHVLAVEPWDEWWQRDAQKTIDANPATFGVARGAISELALLGQERGDESISLTARALAGSVRNCRERAYRLSDQGDAESERIDQRVRSLDLVSQATRAVVIARAGAAMMRGRSAERRLREAMFLQVQAQTARTRSVHLERIRTEIAAD
ncbi:MAG: hypothetical protein RJB01_874 [Actinomycetota bacterium]